MKKNSLLKILILIVILFPFNLQGRISQFSKTLPVAKIDIEKYQGVWFEIARLDHVFERDLVSVTSTYKLQKNGDLLVINKGYVGNNRGPTRLINGRGKIEDSKFPGRLKVSFFWFFWADYTIMEIAPDYSWALIGGGNPNFLWILSRKPYLDEKIVNKLIKKAKILGFKVENLIFVRQQWPIIRVDD